ncbi:MAG: DUF4331 domain-containing protein [Myxococcota bacterium]
MNYPNLETSISLPHAVRGHANSGPRTARTGGTCSRAILLAVLTVGAIGSSQALASSHREAPAIAEDQYVDNTDVYAFISPEDSSKLVIVANYVPLLLPASGPNFYRFSDDARYEIRIDNDGDARTDLTYRFDFETTTRNGNTFLYNTGSIEDISDRDLNVRQTYRLTRIASNGSPRRKVLAREVPVAPWHVGKRSFPNASYEAVARQAIRETDGVRMFVGPRDEPFFVDLQVFDLLGVAGVPTTDGVNVMSIVLELPIADVARDGVRPTYADGTDSVVGIYARALRRRVRVLNRNRDAGHFGGYAQVSRLAWPLVNEVIIPLGSKDKYNRSSPHDDVANFGTFILQPEITGLLNAVLGLGCPATPAGGRTDIVGLLSPNGTVAADLLRINIAEGQTFADSAFPNGRKLTDDVVDTLLTVACNSGSPVGDGVDTNDLPFTDVFPFLATPHSGNP